MMNKHWILLIMYFVLTPWTLVSQNELLRIWAEVENNNMTLRALQEQTLAEKMEARVGLCPDNPEVEFAYLWGNRVAGGNRIDVSVTQSFDFPSAYAYRNQMAKLKEQQADQSYAHQCQQLFMNCADIYYDILYQNVRMSDMRRCLQLLTDLSEAYQMKLESGLITVFECNKVKLAELNLRQRYQYAETERDNLLLQLNQLNGGQPLMVADSVFDEIILPADFNAWYAEAVNKNSSLALLNTAIELNDKQLKLDKSLWAPQFFVGYMREQVCSNEMFQGVKVGLSLPLWHNAHTIRQTQMQQSALKLLSADEQNQFLCRLQAKFATVHSLLKQIKEYEQRLKEINSYELLQIALQKGEISITEYLTDYFMYHDSHEQLLELYRDAYKHYIELQLYTK